MKSERYVAFLEQFLREYFANFDAQPQKILYESMQYSLLAGGKRLRPLLTFEFCRMCSGNWQNAVPFAAAVEMIHTYSLIHDDLPCMDNDDFRRGRPTNHKVYGEDLAVLAGDALLTDAFAVAAGAELPPQAIARGIKVLSECAGSAGMVGGQVLDVMSQQRCLSRQEVLDIQSRKTGALIRAACLLGVIAGGGSETQMQGAREFADALGLAFQIRDDMLDVIGTASEMGKNVGMDQDKNTFIRLYGLEKCEELVKLYTDRAISGLSVFEDRENLAAFATGMTDRRS